MAFAITNLIGAEFPLFAFSHCRDVIVAVSRAGGFGVLGAASHSPEALDRELAWIDDHVAGRPYGVDVLVPEHQAVATDASLAQVAALVPDAHRHFVLGLLRDAGIAADAESLQWSGRPMGTMLGEELMDVAFRHPIALIANALGIAPPTMIARGKAAGVPVAALVGSKEHAVRQVRAGVDIVVAQGTEAGGHCGEVSTLVLIPEVVRALRTIRPVPVLAAGGVMTGGQMAACMALGAAGVWTGSVWLATAEAETSPVFRDKMVSATSRDTIRSSFRTGKPSRQLRSRWHDAWADEDAPSALAMPLMSIVSEPAFDLIDRAAESGNPAARELVTYFVGQGVGLIDGIRSAVAVVQQFKEEYGDAVSDLLATVE